MEKILKEFMVRKLKEPADDRIDCDIAWICSSLGFLTSRDRDQTAFKILKALIEAAREGKGLSSEELSQLVRPTIGSVIYHLKRLMKSGLVVKLNSSYELRMGSLLTTVEEVEKDVTATFSRIKMVADDIDKKMGLMRRSLTRAAF